MVVVSERARHGSSIYFAIDVWRTGRRSGDQRLARLRAGQPLVFNLPAGRPETAEERAARTIPADWLSNLASSPARTVRLPVVIFNGIIEGTVDWKSAVFEREVLITGSEFSGAFDASFSAFRSALGFSASVFRNGAAFYCVDAARTVALDGCAFLAGTVTFADSRLHSVFTAQGLRVASNVNVLFSRTRFDNSIVFSGSSFGGEANFDNVDVAGGAFSNHYFRGKGLVRRCAV